MGAEITEKIFINNKDISDFGAKADRNSISIGGTQITNDYFQGRNRSHYTLMDTTYGLKPISFKLVFFANYLRDAKLQKSQLEFELFGVSEIHMPDGFYYRCMLDSIGNGVEKGVDGMGVMIECEYQLSGIQHDELVEVSNGASFLAKGTLPKMDCKLSVTVGADTANYSLGGAIFKNVHAGDKLVVDGIYKRFLKNGAWTTADSWISFPSVVPGQNSFTAQDVVTVEYYPSYI